MTDASAGLDGSGDGRLLADFRAGRGGAFEAIVRRHYPGLLRLAEQRCGRNALAQDAVQAALVRAHSYLRRNGGVGNLGGWLRRIVHNCSVDLLERERGDRSGLTLEIDIAAPPESTLEHDELKKLIEETIEGLPSTYHAVLRLRYLYGLEATEIAAQLKENIHSIKSRIARGRRELRRRLEPVLKKAGYR